MEEKDEKKEKTPTYPQRRRKFREKTIKRRYGIDEKTI
jgi:hypothetical protein